MKCSVLTKRFLFAVFIIGITVLNYVTALGEEPFAPKITLPEKMENREIWVDMVESWSVPGKDEVGIPVYPGAFIVALRDTGTMQANDDTVKMLPTMTLATKDDRAKVVGFYKEKLKDWKYKNSFDMFDIFWIGQDEFNNFDPTQGMTIPNIVVFGSTVAEPNFMPEAKTTITIVYKPIR